MDVKDKNKYVFIIEYLKARVDDQKDRKGVNSLIWMAKYLRLENVTSCVFLQDNRLNKFHSDTSRYSQTLSLSGVPMISYP